MKLDFVVMVDVVKTEIIFLFEGPVNMKRSEGPVVKSAYISI